MLLSPPEKLYQIHFYQNPELLLPPLTKSEINTKMRPETCKDENFRLSAAPKIKW